MPLHPHTITISDLKGSRHSPCCPGSFLTLQAHRYIESLSSLLHSLGDKNTKQVEKKN